MSKPIFIVRIVTPDSLSYSERESTQNSLTKHLYGWHVLVCYELGSPETKFEAYNSDMIDPIELEKLKDIIQNGL